MTLYLVQHGLAVDKQLDPNRGLSAKGQESVIDIAKKAAKAEIQVSTIYHSVKLRALQTAELFSEHLEPKTIEQISGLSPMDNIEAFADQFQFPDKAMIIGHLPFLERLTSYLIIGDQQPSIVKFQNAGVICLEQDESNHWYLKWTLMPIID